MMQDGDGQSSERDRARRPISVLFPFAGGIVGGSHISALTLIGALDRRRFRPDIVLHSAHGALAGLIAARGEHFELLPEALAPLRPLDLVRTLAARVRFLRARGTQIVHTNEGPMHAAWSPAARLAGARLLWHHRGHPRAKGLRFLAPLFADRVVAVSDFAAPRPGFVSAAHVCSVVRSPFELAAVADDPDAVRRSCRAEVGAPEDAVLLGFFGHLAARKRPLVFVDTVAAVRRLLPGRAIIGLIFGDTLDAGLEHAVRARIIELGLDKHVRLMGFRTPITPWLMACDANIVTAVDEPFGRTLIEAMLLGTPVIAAASGGSLEAIRDGETGFLVPPDQPEAFAKAIVALLRPGRAAALADRAATEARALFGIKAHTDAISAIYSELAA